MDELLLLQLLLSSTTSWPLVRLLQAHMPGTAATNCLACATARGVQCVRDTEASQPARQHKMWSITASS